METNQDPPGRALPAGASPASVHLDELWALIDDIVVIDVMMAALACARAVAIDVGVDLARVVAADTARARSQRTPPENRRARRARGERGPRQ